MHKSHLTGFQESKLTDRAFVDAAAELRETELDVELLPGKPAGRQERKQHKVWAKKRAKRRSDDSTSQRGVLGVAAMFPKAVSVLRMQPKLQEEIYLYEAARYDHYLIPLSGTSTSLHVLNFYGISGARGKRGLAFMP